MPSSKPPRIPSYRRHKPTGQAVVTIAGRDHYLGKWGTPKSRAEYNRLIAERATHDFAPSAAGPDPALTMVELLLAFLRHAKDYYCGPDGQPTGELANFKRIIGRVNALYEDAPVRNFGPLALKTVRQRMIDDGWSRTGINHAVNRIRHIFKWAVENELVPPDLLRALQAVSPLRFGRSAARETEPIKPVPDAFVDAVLPHVAPPVRAIIELQRVSAMRPGEVIMLRACDLDTSGDVWLYRPAAHKNRHRGHQRIVPLGPRAQAILGPWLTLDLNAFLFKPIDAKAAWLAKRSRARKTPLAAGNRPGSNRRRAPRRAPGEHYTVHSYRRAVKYGIELTNKLRRQADPEVAEIPSWHPHQLRHNRATELRREFGIEVARVTLGHKSAGITEIYAEQDLARAIEVAAAAG